MLIQYCKTKNGYTNRIVTYSHDYKSIETFTYLNVGSINSPLFFNNSQKVNFKSKTKMLTT